MVRHHALGEGDEVGQFLDLVIDERDIRGVHGDVAANAAHGNAHIGGLFQSAGASLTPSPIMQTLSPAA